ncbi:MAG: FkbM family methyltransferase [Gemmatimonadales bacterium]|nr:MAG: FkbM family methyltransferase [Gemmatimonadales bacterium]
MSGGVGGVLKWAGKSVEHAIRAVKMHVLLRRRYGTLRPEWVPYPDFEASLSIDPHDQRALHKIALDFARRRTARHIRFWRDFTVHLEPAVCLDVGANYGECLFSLRYPPATRVLGVEANPRILPHLERSRDAHPDTSLIHLHHAIAGDDDRELASLWLEPRWSGRTRAFAGHEDGGERERVEVPATRIDTLVGGLTGPGPLDGPLVFKIDVEGFESFVLRGMARTVAAAPLAVGYVEVDRELMEAAGASISEVDDMLEGFRLFVPERRRGRDQLRPLPSLGELVAGRSGRFHTDVVMVRGEGTGFGSAQRPPWLPPTWDLLPGAGAGRAGHGPRGSEAGGGRT